MKNKTAILVAIMTFINLFIFSCGQNIEAGAGYRLEFLFDRRCITNDVSIWCD